MRLIKDLITKLFKKKDENAPWLEYYSREDRSIKFTNKSILLFFIILVITLLFLQQILLQIRYPVL